MRAEKLATAGQASADALDDENVRAVFSCARALDAQSKIAIASVASLTRREDSGRGLSAFAHFGFGASIRATTPAHSVASRSSVST